MLLNLPFALVSCVSKIIMSTSQHSEDRMKFSRKVLCSGPGSEVAAHGANSSPTHSSKVAVMSENALVCWHPAPGPGLPWYSHPQISGQEWGIPFGASSCWGKWPSGFRHAQLDKPLSEEQFWVLLLRSQQVIFALPATVFFKAVSQ